MNKTIVITITTLLLSRAWFVFSDEHEAVKSFWNYLGLDVTKQYDVHPFYDYPEVVEGEKLKWISHDIGYLLTFILLFGLLKSNITYPPHHRIICICYYFSIFRLLEFLLFRFNVGLTSLTVGIIIYSLLIAKKKWLM